MVFICLSILLICPDQMNFAILATVVLNMASMGVNEKSIMTGTVIAVAIICVLLRMPMPAPISREVKIPAAMTAIKRIPAYSV